jgi:cell division protein FtsZ
MAVLGSGASLLDAFSKANDVLLGAVKGIADLITRDGLINVDFADVKTVMSEMGMAMMGTGRAHGENRAVEAAEAAIRSPLLEDVNLQGARGILVNVTASESLTLGEYSQVGNTVAEFASEQATVIAAGFEASGPNRNPVIPGSGQGIVPGRAGKVTSPFVEPADPASVPLHTNGATVSIGGGGDDDDDVDVPPFMRH